MDPQTNAKKTLALPAQSVPRKDVCSSASAATSIEMEPRNLVPQHRRGERAIAIALHTALAPASGRYHREACQRVMLSSSNLRSSSKSARTTLAGVGFFLRADVT